jgi:hypothetical protein
VYIEETITTGEAMSNKTYIFHEDPGHGWLAVKRHELEAFGIVDQISEFSYENGATVYLEEDCDAPLFVEALKKAGIPFNYRCSYKENTPIRSYRYFTP